MKDYEYQDQGQGLSYLILEKTHFLLTRPMLIKFSLRDCTCLLDSISQGLIFKEHLSSKLYPPGKLLSRKPYLT